MPDRDLPTYFSFFTEVGIIAQLGRALFEARLPHGLLLPHFSVLNHLVRVRDGRTPLELASAFQVPKTTMTHTLAGLEKHGFIRFEANPGDGRSKQVWITDAGRMFREAAIGALGPDIAEIAAAIPEDRVAALLPELEAIRKFLDANRD